MNDFRNSPDDAGPAAVGRRDLLKKGAVAGAIVWTAPMVLSGAASAAEGGGGTPKCRPTITLGCTRYFCEQGNKWFPAIEVKSTSCGCAEELQQPIVCSKFTNIASNCGASVAYGDSTICGPKQSLGGVDEILSTGNWECIDPDKLVYFGRPRSGNGAIPDFGSNCLITFRLGVWAGGCPDQDSEDDAFNCQTWDVTIDWDNGTNTATCTFTPSAPENSLCTDQGETSPCGTCA